MPLRPARRKKYEGRSEKKGRTATGMKRGSGMKGREEGSREWKKIVVYYNGEIES